eukprot:2933814-Pyramimonas_sp.AAC.1
MGSWATARPRDHGEGAAAPGDDSPRQDERTGTGNGGAGGQALRISCEALVSAGHVDLDPYELPLG